MTIREKASDAWFLLTTTVPIIFYFLDLGFDIALAVQYFQEGHVGWGGLTITFVAIPWLIFFVCTTLDVCSEPSDSLHSGLKKQKCDTVLSLIYALPLIIAPPHIFSVEIEKNSSHPLFFS